MDTLEDGTPGRMESEAEEPASEALLFRRSFLEGGRWRSGYEGVDGRGEEGGIIGEEGSVADPEAPPLRRWLVGG